MNKNDLEMKNVPFPIQYFHDETSFENSASGSQHINSGFYQKVAAPYGSALSDTSR